MIDIHVLCTNRLIYYIILVSLYSALFMYEINCTYTIYISINMILPSTAGRTLSYM